MKHKKTIFLALGWTACSAAAFWAGSHFAGTSSAQDQEAARKNAGFAAIRDASEAAVVKTGSAARAPGAGGVAEAGLTVNGKAIRDLTPKETTDRMKEIFAIEDPLARMEAYLAFMKGIQGDEQLAAAMEGLTENYNNRERGREFSMLMTRWAKESPEAALAWTQKHNDWRSSMGAGTVLAIYARSNPEAAIAWANAHPNKDKEEGNYHMASVISGLAKDDLDRAAVLAEGIGRSEARGRAMETVLDNYFKQRGPDAARDAVMALGESPYKNAMVSRLAERLADKDPVSAAKWASSLPNNENKPRVVSEVIDEWADKNPNDAGTWLNGLGNGPAMDEPRERFAWKVQEKDPEAAIAWANSITDERRRNETSFRLVREWMQREPDTARVWVNTSTLPNEMKERLLNNNNNNRRRG